mmetsp:Transcript_53919/g.149965  ORF Transcript_53919/g.149965 Transcript_53919/m.149965 type:complete len:130 (+) Transcript_53919:3-392(+)
MRVQFKVYDLDGQEHLRAGEVTREGGKPIDVAPGEGGRGARKGSKGRSGSKGKGRGKTSGKSRTTSKGKGKKTQVAARDAPWKAKLAQRIVTSSKSKTTRPLQKTVIKTFQKTSQKGKGKGKSGKRGTR